MNIPFTLDVPRPSSMKVWAAQQFYIEIDIKDWKVSYYRKGRSLNSKLKPPKKNKVILKENISILYNSSKIVIKKYNFDLSKQVFPKPTR